jgi:uncharacterized protein
VRALGTLRGGGGHAGFVGDEGAAIVVAAELRFLLRHRYRAGSVLATCDGASTLGHVVQSLGIPLTEVGELTVNGAPAEPGCRLAEGDRVGVSAPERPQLPASQRFALDVHLGTLARRLRLLGLDVSYTNDADDDELIAARCARLSAPGNRRRRRASDRCAFLRSRTT